MTDSSPSSHREAAFNDAASHEHHAQDLNKSYQEELTPQAKAEVGAAIHRAEEEAGSAKRQAQEAAQAPKAVSQGVEHHADGSTNEVRETPVDQKPATPEAGMHYRHSNKNVVQAVHTEVDAPNRLSEDKKSAAEEFKRKMQERDRESQQEQDDDLSH